MPKHNQGKKGATAESFLLREGHPKRFWLCCLASPLLTTDKAFGSSHMRFAWSKRQALSLKSVSNIWGNKKATKNYKDEQISMKNPNQPA